MRQTADMPEKGYWDNISQKDRGMMGKMQGTEEEIRRSVMQLENRELDLRRNWERNRQEEEERSDSDFRTKQLYGQMAEQWSTDTRLSCLLNENQERLQGVERERAAMLEQMNREMYNEQQKLEEERNRLTKLLREEMEG